MKYKRLTIGEDIKDNDEFLSNKTKEWTNVNTVHALIGHKVTKFLRPIRRPVKT